MISIGENARTVAMTSHSTSRPAGSVVGLATVIDTHKAHFDFVKATDPKNTTAGLRAAAIGW
jgi:hypothetical protein